MFPAAIDGGSRGELGDSTLKPKNMNVRISVWRSARSLENTTMTCSHLSCSSAASRSATNASLDPSGSMHGGSAMKSVLPHSTASQGCRMVRKVSRNGGAPLVCPGASGPPQRPCTQRRRGAVGHGDRIGWTLTTHKEIPVKNLNKQSYRNNMLLDFLKPNNWLNVTWNIYLAMYIY